MEKTLITSADTIISPVSTANSSPGEETPSIKKRTLDEFSMLNTLGQGAYGTVRLGKDKLTDKMVAVKCVNKELILRLDKKRHVYREKQLLTDLQHPFIIKLITTMAVCFFTFNDCACQDENFLYFVFENCVQGSVNDLVAKKCKFSINQTIYFLERLHEDLARQYAAQLVSVIEYLQEKRIMHRDMKPQNILLDENFNIKVVKTATFLISVRLTLEMLNQSMSHLRKKRRNSQVLQRKGQEIIT